MDSALTLKKLVYEKQLTAAEEAQVYLNESNIFQQLLVADFEENSLNLLHRLNQLAEIPFADSNQKVQHWCNKLAELTFCQEGFSLTGKRSDLLACYNAMITTVLIKLNFQDLSPIHKGLSWINFYQNVERGCQNNWDGKGILKYGGCMQSTPCFIGVVKSMIALSEANKRSFELPKTSHKKLQQGLEYILEHEVYHRLSNGAPITKDIVKLTYPFTYKVNLIEILRLLKNNNLINDKRCNAAKNFIKSKKKKDGYWRINSFYKPNHWVDFDLPKTKGLWLTQEIQAILN